MKSILFRADAKPSIGIGDLVSLISLSRYFERSGWETHFIVKNYSAATELIGKQKVRNLLFLKENVTIENEVRQINDYIRTNHINVIMFEITERKLMDYKDIDGSVIKTCVNFDGVIPEGMDLVVNWDVNADQIFDIKKYPMTRFLLGPQYAVLPISFDSNRISDRTYKAKPEILLIAMGGADELNFTQKIAGTVVARDIGLKIRIIVGSGYQYLDCLEKGLKDVHCDMTIMQNIDNMFEELMGCDVAIGAGGLTAFELIATRTPSFLMATYEHQVVRCVYFDKMGWATYLGFKSFSKDKLFKSLGMPVKTPSRNIFKTEEIRKAIDELLERR